MDLAEIYSDVYAELDQIGNSVRDHINSRCPLLGIKWNVEHITSVSNTHSHPQNGVENWHCRRDKPHGYPGWDGRLWLRYKQHCEHFGSDVVDGSLTYAGTGGAGDYNGPWRYPIPHTFSWDYRFYDSDFEKLEELISIAHAQRLVFLDDWHDHNLTLPQHIYFWEAR